MKRCVGQELEMPFVKSTKIRRCAFPAIKKINFASRGFITVVDHMKCPVHKQRVAALKNTSTLEGKSFHDCDSGVYFIYGCIYLFIL